MINDDSIVAIATATGVGAISIVRLSGKKSLQIALQISKQQNFTPRLATLTKLYDAQDQMIDQALVIYFQSPNSFTGEDIVEFQCHGGIAVTNMVVQTILSYGGRLATAGEFSKRAYLNGKIDLSQAYAISKLIDAKTQDGVKMLARQLKGELSEFVNIVRDDLLLILSYIEVSIDYAQEDLPEDITEQITSKLLNISDKLTNLLKASQQREGLIEGFKVAIVGKPNVGKSSLLNRLLNFDRAIVSDIAGTTRDTIEESINIGSHIIKIVDTAGIRDANDTIEQIGIEKSKNAIEEADIIIAIFDNSRIYDDEDDQIIELLNDTQKDKIIVLNKSDLENKFDKTKLPKVDLELNISKELVNNPIYELTSKIQQILDNNTLACDMALVSTNQVISVEHTLNDIKEAIKLFDDGSLEFFAYHINEALQSISSITRPYETDEMLDVMFGEFCLGK